MRAKVTTPKGATGRVPARRKKPYQLRLYIADLTWKSRNAIRSVSEVCEEYLQGRHELEIIDIYKKPTLARDDQVVAVPLLIRRLPPPLRRLIGDMADKTKVLVGLDLESRT